jgi:hypothetical protein
MVPQETWVLSGATGLPLLFYFSDCAFRPDIVFLPVGEVSVQLLIRLGGKDRRYSHRSDWTGSLNTCFKWEVDSIFHVFYFTITPPGCETRK